MLDGGAAHGVHERHLASERSGFVHGREPPLDDAAAGGELGERALDELFTAGEVRPVRSLGPSGRRGYGEAEALSTPGNDEARLRWNTCARILNDNKPDAVWDDPAMDRIYADLRGEFDLTDRYGALEMKLRGVQEALELVLDVARDRRLVLLEVAIVLLIVMELALSLLRW